MARGGSRPGAGRPKRGYTKVSVTVPIGSIEQVGLQPKIAADLDLGLMPLDYMLQVVRDPNADVTRRDRMAVAAAPFCHARTDMNLDGKKEKRQANAERSSSEGKFAAPMAPKLAIDNTR